MNYDERQVLIDNFIEGFEKLEKALKKTFFEAIGDSSISPSQVVILFLLDKNGHMSGREIAGRLHITRSAVSQIVDGLEENGFITRKLNPIDRRIANLELTQAGRHKVHELHKKRKQLFSGVTETLTMDELALMIAIHQKMCRQLEDK